MTLISGLSGTSMLTFVLMVNNKVGRAAVPKHILFTATHWWYKQKGGQTLK